MVDNKIKGKANQAVGAAREKAGDITGNESMEAKGKRQHAKGDVQETLGKATDAVDSAADKLKDATDG